MVNHDTAIEFLKQKIQYLKDEVTFLNNGNDFEFSKERQGSKIQEIDDLEGSLITLISIKNESLRIKNNANRLKVIKDNKEIIINLITKANKQYAVVPLEILPKTIIF